MGNDALDDDALVLPTEKPEKLLARQAEERAAMEKRHDRARSAIPRKHRADRARFAEHAAADKARLDATHREERDDIGLTDDQLAAKFAHLSVDLNTKDANDANNNNNNKNNNITQTHAQTLTPDNVQPALQPAQQSEQQSEQPQPRESKAARRRRKKAEEEAASNARVEAARAAMGPSVKALELTAINLQLRPAGLRIHAIKADGHCLYGAVAHQLDAHAARDHDLDHASVESLRAATADHLWRRRDSFMPFVDSVDGDERRFRQYCDTVRDTAEWGGQLELRALAERLGVVIEVYAADMPVVKMGPAHVDDGGERDNKDDTGAGSDEASAVCDKHDKPVLRLSFHRKYLGLGEHYNSVVAADSTE